MGVVQGAYTVTEAATAGWDLTNLACVGLNGNPTPTVNGATANITMCPAARPSAPTRTRSAARSRS